MIFNAKNPKHRNVRVYSYNDVSLPSVYYFNTKTGKTKMYLTGKRDTIKPYMNSVTSKVKSKKNEGYRAKIVKLSLTLQGAYATIDGKRVE